MDNMNNALTNKNCVLEQLMATSAKQSTTIAKQATTIQTFSVEVNKLQLKITNRVFRVGKSDDVRNFLKDGYFWSHRYKVSHMIPD